MPENEEPKPLIINVSEAVTFGESLALKLRSIRIYVEWHLKAIILLGLLVIGSACAGFLVKPWLSCLINLAALNTGMRKGEILSLKWTNVDFKNGVIVVEGTKNGEIRKIPMNQKLTVTLESGKRASRGEYVFSDDGKPYGDVKTGWWSALKKAKIEGFRFHDLRHTFGSGLGMAGVDIRTIQELMGHKDIKMTMRYSHPTPERKKNAVKILDGVTTFFTTVDKNPDSHKVVSIGSY
jgi:integrase